MYRCHIFIEAEINRNHYSVSGGKFALNFGLEQELKHNHIVLREILQA